MVKKAQMKIQQMAFMIVAVFFFFILVGLFFLSYYSKSIKTGYEDLEKEKALSFLGVITNMPELNCDSNKGNCLDEDKLNVLNQFNYETFWPVSSIKVYKIYPSFDEKVACPALNCNYWTVYDSLQKSSIEYSSYVNICKKLEQEGYVYDKCDLGKIVVGVKLADE